MKYLGHQNFHHDTPLAYGVLLVNLGTPDAPDRTSVRRYLKQFLSDRRVVEVPRWLWWFVLRGVILTTRPRSSAHAYRQIWTNEGSPLLAISRRQAQGVKRILEERFGLGVKVELGMSYGNPSVSDGLNRLHQSAVRELLVLPLYPQYSGSTVGSVFDAVADNLKGWRWVPNFRFLGSYHDHPGYVDALARRIKEFWRDHERSEHLVISFHGVPRRYLLNGDPYYCQCHKTARLLVQRLGLAESEWTLVFQSRFGREEWLKPYCDEQLKLLRRNGVKSVDVVCPGFAADCLETLEEINLQYRRLFMDAGGERFNYIPCLNDDPVHLQFLSELASANLPAARGGDGGQGAEGAIQALAKSAGAPY